MGPTSLEKFDKLTGLFTKRFFLDQLDLEVKRCQRYGRSFSLLAFELDYRQAEQDRDVRREMGYVVFKQLGPIVLSTVRNVDIPSRYDGDVFTCFLPETGEPGAVIAAERLRARVEKHRFLGQVGDDSLRFRVNLNVGVAIYPNHGLNPTDLVDAGRAAMATAREQGGNRVCMAEVPAEPEVVGVSAPAEPEGPVTDAPICWDALATGEEGEAPGSDERPAADADSLEPTTSSPGEPEPAMPEETAVPSGATDSEEQG